MAKSNSRMENLKLFLAEDPSDDFSEYALALEYEKTGEIDNAIFHLENIHKRSPEYLAAYYQLGRLLEFKKVFERAAIIYQEGMQVALKAHDKKTYNELQSALSMMIDN